jgi:hypothetical protein
MDIAGMHRQQLLQRSHPAQFAQAFSAPFIDTVAPLVKTFFYETPVIFIYLFIYFAKSPRRSLFCRS